MRHGSNIFKSPKAMVLAVCPKATCTKDWTGSHAGAYTVRFGRDDMQDYVNRAYNAAHGGVKLVSEYQTGTGNPADAWAEAVHFLGLTRPDTPNKAAP